MDTNPLSVFIGQEQAAMIGVPTIFNQASFDSLPLVEFIPHKALNPKRVHELLRMDPPNAMMKADRKPAKPAKKKGADAGGWAEDDQEQVMSFSEQNEMETDVFTLRLLESLDQMTQSKYQPIEIDENILSNMRFEEVYI